MSIDATTGGYSHGKIYRSNENFVVGDVKEPCLKKNDGKYDVDAVNLLASKVDALAQRFDQLSATAPGSFSSMVYGIGDVCELCRIQGHMAINCQIKF